MNLTSALCSFSPLDMDDLSRFLSALHYNREVPVHLALSMTECLEGFDDESRASLSPKQLHKWVRMCALLENTLEYMTKALGRKASVTMGYTVTQPSTPQGDAKIKLFRRWFPMMLLKEWVPE